MKWISNATVVAALCAMAISTSMALAATDKPDKIVVTAFGGVWSDSVKKNYASCFEKKTGVKVEVVTGESAEWLNKIRANPEHSPIDVVTLSELDSLRAGREGLLSKMTTAEVPNLAQVPAQFHEPWRDLGVSSTYGPMGIMYNSEKIKDPPKSWKELIDGIAAGKYGKKVGWPSGTYAWGPPFIWFIAQQYGGDIDVAFAKLKAMQPYVVKFWETPVDALNLFATKQVDILAYWDGRSYAFINKGNPWAKFYIPEPNGMTSLVLFSKVKSAPPIAWEYINCVLSPEAQVGNAEMIRYPGTNKSVKYPEDLRKDFTPFDRVVVPPYDQIIDKIPAWIERWNKEMR